MFLSNLAVKRLIGVIMAVCLVITVGAVSLSRLPIDLLPQMQLPMVVVITSYRGAGPQEVENMVTRPVEEVLSTLGDLQNISSVSSPESSMVMASFSWGKHMDYAAMEIREKLDLITGLLPEEAGDPITFQLDPSLLPVMQIGVEAELPEDELTSLTEQVIKPRLERIEGVAMVNLWGGSYPQIAVEIDPRRLAANDVNMETLAQAIFLENLSYAGGTTREGDRVYIVRTIGQLQDQEQLKNIVVGYNQGGPVTLGQVAEIREHLPEKSTINRLDGRPNLTLAVQKRSDANTVQVARAVRDELQKLEQELSLGVQFAVATDQSLFITDSLRNLSETALIGGVLAALVIFLFLRNFPATLVIGSAIPISLLSTFSLMYFLGTTLNIISLGGLALGAGMMVDNSIVTLENIHRQQSLLADRAEAARLGAGTVFAPILASTLTTVVVFIPIFFIEGITKVIFKPLAATVSFSLLASLLVAMTVIPAVMARIPPLQPVNLAPIRAFERGYQRLVHRYRIWLEAVLKRPWYLIAAVVLLLLISIGLSGRLGGEFIPEFDSPEILVELQLPPGTALKETDRIVSRVEDLLREVPEVEHIFTSIGSGAMISTGTNQEKATINVLLQEKRNKERSSAVISEQIRQILKSLPSLEVSVHAMDATGSSYLQSGRVQLLIKGEQLEVLEKLSREVAGQVEEVPGTREVRTSFDQGRPDIRISVDHRRAAGLGVSTPLVASQVEMALQGKMAARLRQEGKEIEVYIKATDSFKDGDLALGQLPVTTPGGLQVPLEAVADITYGLGPVSINREGQVRVAYISANLSEGYNLGKVTGAIEELLFGLELPPGYTLELGGDALDMVDSFSSLGFALLLAVGLVYMIMAAQFESLLYPFIIMFSLPQSYTGVVLALLVSGYPLSLPALIGAILLAGIVVNNGIILVDYINYLRRQQGLDCREAILEAASTRLRPILMTTGTTVAGMFPLSLGIGSGSEIQAPLATVIIGGLTFSTLITLFLVPAVYHILDRLGRKLRSGRGKKTGRQAGLEGGTGR